MPEPFDPSPWDDIIREATAAGIKASKGAVPGAKLKQLVVLAAKEKGLEYPPDGWESNKFRKFLDYFVERGLLVLRPRDGQDLLIALADQPNMLVETPRVADRSSTSIRNDLFKAFTRISEQTAWYRANEDAVEWTPHTETPDSPGWIRIPSVTIDSAIADRNSFAEGVEEAASERLKATLARSNAIQEFSNVIRELGLQPEWHRFRVKLVMDRLSAWAKENGISWKESWLTSSSDGSVAVTASQDAREPVREWRRSLIHLIETLDQADLERISIPLDIVARALQQRR